MYKKTIKLVNIEGNKATFQAKFKTWISKKSLDKNVTLEEAGKFWAVDKEYRFTKDGKEVVMTGLSAAYFPGSTARNHDIITITKQDDKGQGYEIHGEWFETVVLAQPQAWEVGALYTASIQARSNGKGFAIFSKPVKKEEIEEGLASF